MDGGDGSCRVIQSDASARHGLYNQSLVRSSRKYKGDFENAYAREKRERGEVREL